MHFKCFCIFRWFSVSALLIFGIVFLFFGIGSLIFIPKFVRKEIRENVFIGRFQNGSDNFALEQYKDPKYDIKMQIWVFSVQNPSEIVNKGEKAKVMELGPFTYDIRLHKQNVSFGPNDSRLFYRNAKSFFFNPNLSCANCKLSTLVTVPNIIFQKLIDVFGDNTILIRLIEPFLMGKEDVFVTVTVDELLFKGFEDKLVTQICSSSLTKSMCGHDVPDRIGLFYGQNGTDDGLYEVDTGKENVDRIGHVYSWNGMEDKLDDTHWYGEEARLIRGTDGQLFRPDLWEEQKLQIFLGSLCRSFDLSFDQSLTFSDLPVRRFVLPISLFSSEAQHSAGFCNPNSAEFFHNANVQEVGCAPSGLLDMSSNLPGQPRIFMSAAYFRGAADEFRNSIDVFEAKKAENYDDNDKDSANFGFYDIEPLTGAAVRIQQQYQMNFGMLKGKFRITRNMPNLVMPMIRMNQIATVDPFTKERLLFAQKMLHFSHICAIVLISLGALLTIISIGLATLFAVKKRKKKIAKGTEETPPAEENNNSKRNAETVNL